MVSLRTPVHSPRPMCTTKDGGCSKIQMIKVVKRGTNIRTGSHYSVDDGGMGGMGGMLHKGFTSIPYSTIKHF